MLENNPGKLYERGLWLEKVIDQRSRLVKRFGRIKRNTDSSKKLNRVNSLEGRVNASVVRLNSKLGDVNHSLETLLIPEAQEFRRDRDLMRNQLLEMEEYAHGGYVEDSYLKAHQIRFKQFEARIEREPWLKRVIDKLDRQEEENKARREPRISLAVSVGEKPRFFPPEVQRPLPARGVSINITVDLVDGVLPKKPNELASYDALNSQVAEVRILIGQFQSGKLAIPSPDNFLEAKNDDERLLLATDTLKGLIATTIAQDINKIGQLGLGHKLAVQVNQLAHMLGQTRGRDIIVRALETLPTLQRTMLYAALTTNLKEQLDYPDVDECSEMQMAVYLRHCTWPILKRFGSDRFRGEIVYEATEKQLNTVERLISSALERSLEGDFDCGLVIENILSASKSGYFLTCIAKLAEMGSFLDLAERFFKEHGATTGFARECSRLLNQDTAEIIEE